MTDTIFVATWRGAKGLSRWKKAAIVTADILLVGVLGYFLLALGVASRELTLFLLIQLLAFFVLAFAYFGYASASPDRKARAERRMAGAWDGGALVLVLVAAVAIHQRVEMDGPTLAIFWLVVLAILAALSSSFLADTGLAGRARGRMPSAPQVGTVLIVVSFLVAWGVTSAEWWSTRPRIEPGSHDQRQRVIEERLFRRLPGLTVAVTLSGGAYRAAAFHAGVLNALDRAEIRVDYLSTNSGGSIVGSYYAVGHTPEEFLARLKERPQLPNDFFSIDVVLRDLVWPGYTRGDAYTEHFDRILFGRRFLGEGCWPTLLVNVTDYESGRQKVYQCSVDPSPDAKIPVARAVAASGALPIIAGSVLIRGRHNLDGAARDNLGYVGLETYFDGTNRTVPGIIVISNATLPLARKKGPQKIWLGEGFLRGYTTLLDEARTRLLSYVSAGRYMVRRDTPDRVKGLAKAKDFHINLNDAANDPPEECVKRFGLQEVREAPTLSSLHELSARQAELLFCLGDKMMKARVDGIVSYARDIRRE